MLLLLQNFLKGIKPLENMENFLLLFYTEFFYSGFTLPEIYCSQTPTSLATLVTVLTTSTKVNFYACGGTKIYNSHIETKTSNGPL